MGTGEAAGMEPRREARGERERERECEDAAAFVVEVEHQPPPPPPPPPSSFFDDDRPQYHVQPPAGWMNDPNGPIYYKGRYHMFYQYLPGKCEWDFGIVWGHAYSEDLVHWEHLEPALVPSPGWVDADGCFSGCCVVGEDGRPVILYTGVRLRSNHETGPLPPGDQDLGMVFIESQCAAVPADDSDELLVQWEKVQVPFLGLPPKHSRYDLTGWRDPFIVYGLDGRAADHDAFTYHMLIGSGIKDRGGTALVYGSKRLEAGWELLGLLCEGNHEVDETGVVWECPLVVRLSERCAARDAEGRDGGAGASGRHAPSWLWRRQRVDGEVMTSAQRLLEAAPGGFGGVGGTGTRSSVSSSFGRVRQGRSNLGRPDTQPSVTTATTTTTTKQPGFAVSLPVGGSRAELANASIDSSSSSLASMGGGGAPAAPAGGTRFTDGQRVKRNPSISLLAQKLEQVAIDRTMSGSDAVDTSGANDGSSSEAPSIASRVNSAKPDGITIDEGVDSFEALRAKVKPLNVSRAIAEEEGGTNWGGFAHDAEDADDAQDEEFKATDWHLFTVSPDAPTNPVLFWIGHMVLSPPSSPSTTSAALRCPKFDIANAHGPFKLDLGDILYAPNVCQDGRGRWLLWGWLQERRKVGSYAYAGCLTLPRILTVTSEGRLIQAPVPEVDKLRTKERKFSARRVALQPEMTFPIKYVRSERLDIQCSIERGASTAAGLLFRSHEAEADGSTAIIYDWSTNQLEAIFNVPPNWKPHVGSGVGVGGGMNSDVGGSTMDDGMIRTVSARNRAGGPSRDSVDSNVSSCDPAAMLSRTPRNASFSMEQSVFESLMSQSDILSGPGSPLSPGSPSTVASPGPGSPQLVASDLEVEIPLSPSMSPLPETASLVRSGSSMAMAMRRNTSVTNLATGEVSMGTSHLGTSIGGSQLGRSLSMVKEQGIQGVQGIQGAQVGSLGGSSLAGVGTLAGSANAMAPGSLTNMNFMRSTSLLNLADMDAGAGIEDEDLGNLLEDLAAPMRTEEEAAGAPAHAEPRRVGGPLAMTSTQTLHLRIFVDHSSIEVFTGTGECLSTRIYRGRGPNPNDPGIEFVSFGGQATVDACECYEMISCWKEKVQTPLVRRSFDSSLRSSLDKDREGADRALSRPTSLHGSFLQRIDSFGIGDRVDSFCVDSTQTEIISPPLLS